MNGHKRPAPVANCLSPTCTFCASLAQLPRDELQRIGRRRTFLAGETVQAESAGSAYVGHVLTGVLRLQRTLHDGRQQIVGLLMPGESYGRVFGHSSQVAIEAATDVVLCSYRRQSFEALFARFPELEHKMLASVTDELDAAQDWMMILATQPVTGRIAAFLLNTLARMKRGLSAGADSRDIVDVPISRKDFAAYLGTTVESISRSTQQLARDRLIRIIDPHQFELLDLEGLGRLSPDTEERKALNAFLAARKDDRGPHPARV